MDNFKVYLFIACGILLLVLLIGAFLSLFIALIPFILPAILILAIIGYFANRRQERVVREFFNNTQNSTQNRDRVFNENAQEFYNNNSSDDVIDVEAKEVK